MKAAVAILALALSACASVDYKTWEGKPQTLEGQGGTKESVLGIDFWADGAPPRKYKVVGMVTSQVSEGYGDMSIVQKAVAGRVKKEGGDAAILLTEDSKYAGTYTIPGYSTTTVNMVGNQAYASTVTNPGMAMAWNVKTVHYAIVKYVD